MSFDLSIKDYAIAAGATLRLGIPSSFFQVMHATDDLDIDFLQSGSRIGRAEGVGQGFRLGPLGSGFHQVDLYSATAQTVKLCFSSGSAPVDLSQVVEVSGTVSTVNGEMARVLDGRAFSSYAYQAGIAGEFSAVQLWNPAGSGKNLIVTGIFADSTGRLGAKFDSAQKGYFALAGLSKLSGAANSDIGTRPYSQAASLMGDVLTFPDLGNSDFLEPLIVTPGYGLSLFRNVVNTAIECSFRWFEELIV
jgi:hypothetical protein